MMPAIAWHNVIRAGWREDDTISPPPLSPTTSSTGEPEGLANNTEPEPEPELSAEEQELAAFFNNANDKLKSLEMSFDDVLGTVHEKLAETHGEPDLTLVIEVCFLLQ